MTRTALQRRPERPGERPGVDTAHLERLVAAHPLLARAIKRTVDIAVSSLFLLLTGPLLLLLALLIRLESRGPALYRQPRMGHRQRPFVISKLRTMDQQGRVTRLGRLLRPTGLDELPQLWHVLTGHMSLIGPRPEVLDRVPRWQREIPWYWARHLMRPGITGWAQVNGLRGDRNPAHAEAARSPAPAALGAGAVNPLPSAGYITDRVRLDLEYVASWSLLLDLRILLRTVGTVWNDTRRG